MPAERLTHPRIGHSRKVVSLTDTEFRIWDTYRWCADDFGVMPKLSEKLQGENEALARHPKTVIDAGIEALLRVELVAEFEHQGTLYLCSLNWQTHQKVKYPRSTFLPCPPPEVVERMDDPTRKLFREFHERFQKISKRERENSAPRARGRARRALALAEANAEAVLEGAETFSAPAPQDETPEGRLVGYYRSAFEGTTGARPDLDDRAAQAVFRELLKRHDEAAVATAVSAMFEHGDAFVRRAGYPLTLFRKQFNAFVAAGAKQPRKGCGHTPPCRTNTQHINRILRDDRRGEASA
jgi:hypothetical protein